jgi:hypothetical protein
MFFFGQYLLLQVGQFANAFIRKLENPHNILRGLYVRVVPCSQQFRIEEVLLILRSYYQVL